MCCRLAGGDRTDPQAVAIDPRQTRGAIDDGRIEAPRSCQAQTLLLPHARRAPQSRTRGADRSASVARLPGSGAAVGVQAWDPHSPRVPATISEQPRGDVRNACESCGSRRTKARTRVNVHLAPLAPAQATVLVLALVRGTTTSCWCLPHVLVLSTGIGASCHTSAMALARVAVPAPVLVQALMFLFAGAGPCHPCYPRQRRHQ